MDFNWLEASGLFLAAMVLDAIYALYTVAIVKTQAFRAAGMSLLTYLIAAIGVVSYVHNRWYVIPLSLGAFAGSYIIVKFEANKKKAAKKTKT